MGVVVKVTLDPETFKALASPTRLSVLRALDARRKTVTELARDLDMNKATIHEHLQLLAAADLVSKKDEGRKWIYYELTWRGQRILHPQETTTFNLLLAVSVAAAGGGVAMLGRALEWWWADQASDELFAPFGAESQDPPTSESQPADSGDDQDNPETATTTPNEPPRQDGPVAEGDRAASGAGTDGTFWDEDGILAVTILALSILSAVFAGLLWRRLRPGPPEQGGPGDDGSA